MDTLEAINHLLQSISQPPVNQADESDPDVALGLNVLEKTRKKILQRPWHFNTDKITLSPNVSGRVPVPSNLLQIALPDKDYTLRYDGTSGPYVWDTRENDWVNTTLDPVYVTRNFSFEYLPYPFQWAIVAESAKIHYMERLGMVDNSYIKLEQEAKAAMAALMNSHHETADLFYTLGVYRMDAAFAGSSPLSNRSTLYDRPLR